MKKIMFLLLLVTFVACQEKVEEESKVITKPSIAEITEKMGCENCGMNIERFIQTGHAIHTAEGKNHFYCSINCATSVWNKKNLTNASVFGIDKESGEYVPVENLFYVVGSKRPAVMSRISKYAFIDSAIAKQFKMEYEGDSIISYNAVFKMCEKELVRR